MVLHYRYRYNGSVLIWEQDTLFTSSFFILFSFSLIEIAEVERAAVSFFSGKTNYAKNAKIEKKRKYKIHYY